MRIIGVTLGVALLATTLAAQEVKTTTKETTKFKVTDGHDMKVSGCLQAFEDAGYMLTTDTGDLKYVLVTNDNLSKYVGHRVEVKGVGADNNDGKIRIEKEVGTTGEVGGRKTDDNKTKKTTEVKNPGFPYLSVKSLKKISNSCE